MLCFKNAIDTESFRFSATERNAIRGELDISEDAFVIGHIGRFAEQKNHQFLVETFAQVKKNLPNAVLLLVGGGELRHQIETEIIRCGLAESVVFAGVRSDVHRLYHAMDVFVFPSLYEGLGIVVIEAQAAGLPCCISSNVPREAMLTKLAQQRPLRDGAKVWADWIVSRKNEPRVDTIAAIRQAGYDISTTTAWLQYFYESIVKKHE